MKDNKRQEMVSETKVLGTLFFLPILFIAFSSMWIRGLEDPGPPPIVSSIALVTLFSIMPLSVVVLLLLYRSFKKNTTVDSFRRRALMLFLIALVPSLSGTFVSLFNYSLVELGKILGAACSLLAYGFTMAFCERLLDRRFEEAQG